MAHCVIIRFICMMSLFPVAYRIGLSALIGLNLVSCLQSATKPIKLTRAQVVQKNAAQLEWEYREIIAGNRKEQCLLQRALQTAVRAELKHADCAANGCWCEGKSVSTVRISADEWPNVLAVLRRIQPLMSPHRETVVPSDSKVWSINEAGKVVYRPFIHPPLQLGSPRDYLALYDSAGKMLCEVDLWSITRQSRSSTPEEAGCALVLSDADMATLASMPSFRAFFRFAAADWANADWILFSQKSTGRE